jgi:hypothetical protein
VRFFLGTHMPCWLASLGVPLFVSHRRLAGMRRLPRAATCWASGSGGFSELSLYGAWRTSPRAYAGAIVRYRDEIGSLAWAAPQDWMCEPPILAKTGRSVAFHQAVTVASVFDLRDRVGPLVIPVLRGLGPGRPPGLRRALPRRRPRPRHRACRRPRVGLPPPGRPDDRGRRVRAGRLRDRAARLRDQDQRPRHLRRPSRVRGLDGVVLHRPPSTALAGLHTPQLRQLPALGAALVRPTATPDRHPAAVSVRHAERSMNPDRRTCARRRSVLAGGESIQAVGLLHVLAAFLSGGGAGSRAFRGEEVRTVGAGSRRLAWGLLRRALEPDPPPETLRARREGAHPTPRGAA